MKDRTLVVMGYSGGDDFDINPVLSELKEFTALVWVDHSQEDEIEVYKYEIEKKSKASIENQFKPMLLEFGAKGVFDVYYIKANTANFVSEILKTMLIESPPEQSGVLASSEVVIPKFDRWCEEKKLYSDLKDYKKWMFAWRIYYSINNLEGQERCLKGGYVLVKQAKDKKAESIMLSNLGFIASQKGDKNKALELFEESMKINKELKYYSGLTATLNNIGIIYLKRGNYDKALKYYKETLEFIEKELSKEEYSLVFEHCSTAINNIAYIYDEKGDLNTALKYYEDSLKIDEEIGDLKGKSTSLNNIGEIHRKQGNFDDALKYYKESLKLDELLGISKGIGIQLKNIGAIYSAKGKYNTALKYFKEGIEVSEQTGDNYAKASCLRSIGDTYSDQSYYEKAIDSYIEALNFNKNVGLTMYIPKVLNAIGSTYTDRGKSPEKKKDDYDNAFKYYKDALKAAEKYNNFPSQANALSNIGVIYNLKKKFDEALEYYQKALAIGKEKGLIRSQSLNLNFIGKLYRANEDYDKAIYYLNEALKIAVRNSDKHYYHSYLGEVYKKKENYSNAIKHYSEALNIAKILRENKYIANYSKELGIIYSVYQKDYDKSIEMFNEALQYETRKYVIADILGGIGANYLYFKKKKKEASKYLNKALEIFKEIDNKKQIKSIQAMLDEI